MTIDYDDTNILAKILRDELPSAKLFETEEAIAIMDVMPQTKGHCLVIPKAASRNLLDAGDETLSRVMPQVARLARAVKAAFSADGVVVAQFNEAPAGQTIFHLHFHVIPRYEGETPATHARDMADPAILAKQAALIREKL